MLVRIYQIVPELDKKRIMFCNLEFIKKAFNNIPSDEYECVFSGELDVDNPEDTFFIFNTKHPSGYKGRSMSVSDVVEFEKEGKSTFYFCDSFGFKEIDFDKKKIVSENLNNDSCQ